MNSPGQASRSLGGYWIGFVVLVVVLLRDLLNFQGTPALTPFLIMLAGYTLLYSLEPWLSRRFYWFGYVYFPIQIGLVMVMSNLEPFIDMTILLLIPLAVQAQRLFSHRIGTICILFMAALLVLTFALGISGLGWLGLSVLSLAIGAFLLSYDRLFFQTQAEEKKSQVLLSDLRAAHHKLELSAVQAEELAAARERNRLARELHDSVSQVVFSIQLTTQSACLLLERDPERVPELIDRLQEMTGSALAQLRSLIAELRPPRPTDPAA